jgi:hypothetical protein
MFKQTNGIMVVSLYPTNGVLGQTKFTVVSLLSLATGTVLYLERMVLA